ncbi:MAG: GTP-binding protein [Candidatus Heimdallarchaeota archaeon]|nr:GTP-binding protein [Candidatus Heimdallarchaeota archaeon]
MSHNLKEKLFKISSDRIRNLSIISHVDHGKTTLSDYLIASGGMLPEHLAGSARALDFLPQEQRRGITIESSLATFIFKEQNEEFLVNLIDTPGHVDFSGKVAESLRLVDGAIILVDAVEGIMAQTKTVLIQAIRENIDLVLFINKIDRLIKELGLDLTGIQKKIELIIGEIRNIYLKFSENDTGHPKFSNGTIILGSAIDGWAIDAEYVNQGGKLSNIVELYSQENIQINPKISLPAVMKRVIVNKLPSPVTGQRNKFPSLIVGEVDAKLIRKLRNPKPTHKPVVLLGRLFRFSSNNMVAFMARVITGTVKKGLMLTSSSTGMKTRINRILNIHGRTIKDTTQLNVGQIGGLVLSRPSYPGDFLTLELETNLKFKNFSYVQEAVVAVSIEPRKINDLSKLHEEISKIAEITPGLEFETNKDTGEMLALGVGTLQLDILTSDLKAVDFDIEVSEPNIIKFEIPTTSETYSSEKTDGVIIHCSRFLRLDDLPMTTLIYEDSHNNKFFVKPRLKGTLLEGILSVFQQYMKISPLSGIKIKDFIFSINDFPEKINDESYENGIVIGSMLIKEALTKSRAKVHEPHYTLEINSPEKFLGSIIQELMKSEASVVEINTNHGESEILAVISVFNGLKIADTFRAITDGYIFWAFPEINFLPVHN